MAIRFLLILLALLVIVTIACIHEGQQFTIQVKESAKDKPLCYLVSQGHACKTLDYILGQHVQLMGILKSADISKLEVRT